MNFFDNMPHMNNNPVPFNNTGMVQNDLMYRINEIENRIKKIEQRLARLEAAGNNNNYNYSEPDTSMYMI